MSPLVIYGESILASAALFIICLGIVLIKYTYIYREYKNLESYKPPGWHDRSFRLWFELVMLIITLLFITICPMIFMEPKFTF